MHIAICDDNVADRKQTERLMGREADKWIAEGDPMYTYSYGSASSLLDNLMKFDAILMDIRETEGMTTVDLIDELALRGSSSTLVILDEEENYLDKPGNFIFLPKPIRPISLHEVMLQVKENSSLIEPMIELRGEHETLYVKEGDILYAEEIGRYTHVTLVDKKEIKFMGTVANFYGDVEAGHPSFICPTKKLMINMRYIEDYTFIKITMVDKKTFTVGTGARKLFELSREI